MFSMKVVLLICNYKRNAARLDLKISIFEYYFPKDNDIIAIKSIRRFESLIDG